MFSKVIFAWDLPEPILSRAALASAMALDTDRCTAAGAVSSAGRLIHGVELARLFLNTSTMWCAPGR